MERLAIWYAEIIRYLQNNRIWILAALLMIIEILIFTCLHAEPNQHYEQYVAETLPEYPGLLWFIVLENLKSAAWLVVFGFVPCGLGILFGTFMAINGLVTTMKWLLPLAGAKQIFLGTVSHGIFEIPAIIFSVVLGVLLSKATTVMLLEKIRGIPKSHSYKGELCLIWKSVGLILVPLFTIAGVVEVTISCYLV